MKSAFYDWMKNLAAYYVFLCMIVNLAPNAKYVRYFRYMMGMFLITILCTPIFAFFSSYDTFIESFQKNILENEQNLSLEIEKMQESQYRKQTYQEEINLVILQEIKRDFESIKKVKATLDENMQLERIEVYVSGGKEETMEEAVKSDLEEKYGIIGESVVFIYQESEDMAMGDSSSSGDSSGNSCNAGEE